MGRMGNPMKKQTFLNQWLWKWHIIAGLITLPFMLILAITGTIYLFKPMYEASIYEDIYKVKPAGERLSYAAQFAAAQAASSAPVNSVTLPRGADDATMFQSGMWAGASMVYVNPYTGDVTGTLRNEGTFMSGVREMHGELFLSKPGTYVVELVASWFLVLILTGLYVWWPARGWSLRGFFTIRLKQGKRIFFRDLHSVTAFWLSTFLLIILAGGLPWTDVFGKQFQRLQNATGTGFPQYWVQSNGLQSINTREDGLSIDDMVQVAQQQNLKGDITVRFPANENGVFSVANKSLYLHDQSVRHFDLYSGSKILDYAWKDVGPMMAGRLFFMRLHEGQYGLWNWVILLCVALSLIVSIIAALTSYIMRKQKGSWSIPKPPAHFKVGWVAGGAIVILGAILPLFGASLILLFCITMMGKMRASKA